MQPWRAIHLLAPDSWEAGVYFKTSFSLRRDILRGTHGKKASRTARVLAGQPWPQGGARVALGELEGLQGSQPRTPALGEPPATATSTW